MDLERTDRLRITMTWDTDGNDVDLHVVDPRGAHVYYGAPNAPSGVELLEDITQGFGPEVVRTSRVRIEPFRLLPDRGEVQRVLVVRPDAGRQ